MQDDLIRVDKKGKEELKIILDLPLSQNHMYYNTRNGGKRLTAKAEKYMKQSKAKIKEEMEKQKYSKKSKGVWLYADLAFYYPDKRIRDSHNMLKLLMDTLESVVYENDYCCLPRIMLVELDRKNPRLEIIIKEQKKSERNKLLGLFSNTFK